MSKYGNIRDLERRIRASITYADWVKRNKSAACLGCGTANNLELHHLVELVHIVTGLWKLYGSEDDVFSHALAMHQDDRVESVTLCCTCHSKRHPGRSPSHANATVFISNWTVLPRNSALPFSHSTN